jgi:sulfur carrier protein ThiS
MNVRIFCEGHLKRITGFNQPIEVLPGQNIRQAASAIGIPETQPVAAIVNGQVTDLSYQLHSGDEVHLIPPISGG